jgi:quercetin dioxygenase-like cupin family protein
MKIIRKQEAVNISKPEGVKVEYFLFDEYEVHYNEQIAGSTTTWHYHKTIWETLFIIEGELTVQWKDDNGEIKSEIVKAGDLIEVERIPHAFTNHTDRVVKFLVTKQILKGDNCRDIFKTDKVV